MKSAFSLLELIVSVAIVSVLVALGLKVFASGQSSAQQVQCTQNLRLIGTAIQSYMIENKGVLPGPQFEIVAINATSNIPRKLAAYTGEADLDKLWSCPANSFLTKRNKTENARYSAYISHYPFFGYQSTPPKEPLLAFTREKIQEEYPPEQHWLLSDIDFWNYKNAGSIGGEYGPIHRGGRNVLYFDARVQWVKSQPGIRP